jgi:hemin uptake protein HemP
MQADRPAPDNLPEDQSAALSENHRSPSAAVPRVMHSAALLGGQSQLAILHNETVYFLRQTRFGKLILTK